MIRRMSFLTFLLAIVFSAVPSFGGDVYMYDDAVADQVNIGRFTTTGEVAFLRGISKFCDTGKGPAPAPYPQINFWEPGYEVMGASNAEVDGIWFINLGNHWVKNKLALVLWKIVVPNANARMTGEFEEDLTVSMWVDWDQDEGWDKNELMIRKQFNISHLFPTDHGTLCVYYLTAFRVPDVFEMASASWFMEANCHKEILYYWVRGSLAYDDGDVSPDGEQLFGEAEDYRVGYMLTGKQKKNYGD